MNAQQNTVNPLVTIVIPVYNGEKYIKSAINSALAQTYQNIEIIVVDDGSTDKTGEIVKLFSKRVKYIKKQNGGVSSALNLAISEMKGEYFSWLSHDDTYEPTKIESEINFLVKNNYIGKKIIVFSDYYLINKSGGIIANCIKDHDEIAKKPEYAFLKGHINGLSLLIPKSAFNEYGGFDTTLKCIQDYEKWYEMSKTYKFIHIPEILVSTRYHSRQVSNTSPKVAEEGNQFYLKLIKNISSKRMIELEGSEYCFYRELADFYQNTPYREVKRYCDEQAEKLFNLAKRRVSHTKVSVVIPFFNRTQETISAVSSVLKQTHKNIEIILIDDGSTVDVKPLANFIKSHPNIFLFKNDKNLGPSAARNKGISAASGDFIVFLDSDDEFVPDKIVIQLQYAIAAKAKISHTSYLRRMSSSDSIIHSGVDNGHCEKKLMYHCPIATPTVMIDRKWLKAKNFHFNENIHIGEDVILWLTIMKNNTYLLGIDKPLTIVNVSRKTSAYSIDKQIIGLKNIITFLLNDEYYMQFNESLARLMASYCHYIKTNLDFSLQFKLENKNIIQKMIFFAKTEGIKSVAKRSLIKIQKTLKPKRNLSDS